MSKLYIFGIGGTGSRVLRSLTMMLAAGVKVAANEIIPIVIDPDSANADLTRTVQLMTKYGSIRKEFTFPENNKSQFFRTGIRPVTKNYSIQIADTQNKRFNQFIGLNSMSLENQAMAKMLFSEKNLDADMNVGFKGNPNIGSVVLNQIVSSPDFEAFANTFEAGDKIFIISSIFGGTGASGFPLLLKTLRTANTFSNYDIINKSEIGAITILPYFMLKSSEESEIDSSTFISKTKSALAYYENNISMNGQINALYFLGDTITNLYENHEGGTLQQNDAHLIEFLSATAIVDFVNKTHDGTVNKELGLNDLDDAVSFSSFPYEISSMLMKPLTQFVLMANAFHEKRSYLFSKDLNANYKVLGEDIYRSPLGNGLVEFLSNYRIWLQELKNNKRSLDLFNLDCGDKPFDLITGVTAKKIFSKYSNYDLVYDRLNDAINKCSCTRKEDQLMEMYYLATEKLIKEKFNI